MKKMTIFSVLIIFALLFGSSTETAAAQSDTREERLAAAREYHELTRFSERLKFVAPPTIRSGPGSPQGDSPEAKRRFEEQRAAFIEAEKASREKWDVKMLEEASLNALADTFTTEELSAINTFFKSPAGSTYLDKLKIYSEKYIPIQSQERDKHFQQPRIEQNPNSASPQPSATNFTPAHKR